MIVNYEFLSVEPLNNVITCMHYAVDKVVFFGYERLVERTGKLTETFLKKHCGVKEVSFIVLPKEDFPGIRRGIRTAITIEAIKGHELYFDITGGDSLILVAFGQLSEEFGVSMHMYNVAKDALVEFDDGSGRRLSNDVERRDLKMNLDRMIELRGGRINYKLQKQIKQDSDPQFREDVDAIFDAAKAEWEVWNPFSEFLRSNMIPDETLTVVRKTETIAAELKRFGGRLKTIDKLNDLIDALAAKGILLDVVHDEKTYRFRFKNEAVKDCIWESGSILEMNVYGHEKEISDDCRVGVHLDWDGVVGSRTGTDVLNEIDVLTLKGNIMTFISCKSGKMDSKQSLHALYELDAVAGRFGGRYARKVLVSAQPLSEVYLARASEMGIEVRSE